MPRTDSLNHAARNLTFFAWQVIKWPSKSHRAEPYVPFNEYEQSKLVLVTYIRDLCYIKRSLCSFQP